MIEFSWSPKRNKCFKTCKRKYFYEYYGYNKGWFPDSPKENQEIYRLKKLKTIPYWIGGLVSNQIIGYLVKLQRGSKELNSELLNKLGKQFKKDFKESEEGTYKENPKKFCDLRIHEYSINVDEDYVKKKLEFAKKCFLNFLNSKTLKEIQSTDPKTWLFRRDYDEGGFPNFQFRNTKIYAVFKFGILNKKLVLYDWTTAREENKEGLNEIKNGVLLKFFSEKENLPVDKIKLKRLYLLDGSSEEKNFSNKDINEIENHMGESISKMRSISDNEEENTASKNKFPKTQNESNCKYCKYKKKCFPGATSVFRGRVIE